MTDDIWKRTPWSLLSDHSDTNSCLFKSDNQLRELQASWQQPQTQRCFISILRWMDRRLNKLNRDAGVHGLGFVKPYNTILQATWKIIHAQKRKSKLLWMEILYLRAQLGLEKNLYFQRGTPSASTHTEIHFGRPQGWHWTQQKPQVRRLRAKQRERDICPESHERKFLPEPIQYSPDLSWQVINFRFQLTQQESYHDVGLFIACCPHIPYANDKLNPVRFCTAQPIMNSHAEARLIIRNSETPPSED